MMTSPSPKQDSAPCSNDGFGPDCSALAAGLVATPTIQSMIRSSSSHIKQEHAHVSLNSSIRQKSMSSYSSSSASSGYIKKHKSGKGSGSTVSAKVNDYRKVSGLISFATLAREFD